MKVAAVKTPFTSDGLLAALRDAWRSQLGGEPANHSLAVLAAQVALETANGAACICWNLGNFKASGGADVCSFLTTEWIGMPPAPVKMTCDFAAYPTLAAGVAKYLGSMYTHWTVAWTSVCSGNPEGFAQGLRAQGYYTAPVAQYAAGVRRWFDYYMAHLGGDGPPTVPEVEPIRVSEINPEWEALQDPPPEAA